MARAVRFVRQGRAMNANFDHPKTRATLLARRGILVAVAANEQQDDATMRALELELAALGYACTAELAARLRTLPTAALGALHHWMLEVLAEHRGSNQNHKPLYRNFPDGVPADTFGLWVDRLLVHFFQAEDQPCLHCERVGSTHVLDPCCHVVCEHCFDGGNYSGCPVCGHKVDPASPFFKPTKPREAGAERIRFELLHLREDIDVEARAFFELFCDRPQPLSPDDRSALLVLLEDYGEQVLDWLPEKIVLRENIAQIFGTLFDRCEADNVLKHASRYMTTATDVLRFIAAYSGADPALNGELRNKEVSISVAPSGYLQRFLTAFGGTLPPTMETIWVPQTVKRFEVAKLSRPLRRALLGLLERLPRDTMVEDMLRHRSHWVWVGQFLHPHEYAKRYPNTARAFKIVRKKGPDGTVAPKFTTFYGTVEAAARAQDARAMTDVLRTRPGEFARRLDHTLRLATDVDSAQYVLETAEALTPGLATPMLLGLKAHFSTRTKKAPVRVYWPAGASVTGVSGADQRPVLKRAHTDRLCQAFETELLRRFEQKGGHKTWVVDQALTDIIVPFNERSASSAAVELTRGSHVDIPTGKVVRLFLHWCDPPSGGYTDLDLSVAFYDAAWEYVGVCSYYELKFDDVAKSAGDFTSAPYPDGASEFVDIDLEAARAKGVRYAVMVVNAYSGLPFGSLERAFAGLMLRDGDAGLHFDPRTVELKFQLAGSHGVFLPLVLDLETDRLHWLDVYSQGEFIFNNVATSTRAIQRICPEAIAYFASGCRATLYELGLLHAASRANRVFIRGERLVCFERNEDESSAAFLARLRSGEGGEVGSQLPAEPVAAMLHRGDIELAPESDVYVLFREQLSPTLAASDLLS